MKKQRLYFLVPNEQSAHAVTECLRARHIDDNAIHAIAKRNRYPLEDIPEATPLQETDVVHAGKRGAAIGGATGLFAGLAAVAILPLGVIAAGGAIAALTASGAAIGGWSSTMIGVSVINTDIKQFEDAIDRGDILILVDVPAVDANRINDQVLGACPDAIMASGSLETAAAEH